MISMLFAAALSTTAITSKAQVSVGVNINIGDQPQWGPVGYDYAEYYYLPDIETYYYVPQRQFVYFYGNRWIFSAALPPSHAHYNLYSGYKVVLNSPKAYYHFNTHKVKYAEYKGYKNKQSSHKYKHNNGKQKNVYKKKGKK